MKNPAILATVVNAINKPMCYFTDDVARQTSPNLARKYWAQFMATSMPIVTFKMSPHEIRREADRQTWQ